MIFSDLGQPIYTNRELCVLVSLISLWGNLEMPRRLFLIPSPFSSGLAKALCNNGNDIYQLSLSLKWWIGLGPELGPSLADLLDGNIREFHLFRWAIRHSVHEQPNSELHFANLWRVDAER